MVDRLSEKLGLSIFSFSVFHVFFEQYLTIARDTLHILGAHLCLRAALLLHPLQGVQHRSLSSEPHCTQLVQRFPSTSYAQSSAHIAPRSGHHLGELSRAGAAGVAVLAVCWLMTGSLWASALMLVAIAMVLLDMGGAMYLAGIQLNAVRMHFMLSVSADGAAAEHHRACL